MKFKVIAAASLLLISFVGHAATDADYKEQQRKSYCASLSAERDRIVEAQRRNSTPYLAEQLKEIDSKMFSNDCHK